MDVDKRLDNFKDAANMMNAAQQKTQKFIQQDEVSMRWRNLFNSLDEMSFIIQQSSLEEFNPEMARIEYAANFPLNPAPHPARLHPLHNSVFAQLWERNPAVRRSYRLHEGPWYAWENNPPHFLTISLASVEVSINSHKHLLREIQ